MKLEESDNMQKKHARLLHLSRSHEHEHCAHVRALIRGIVRNELNAHRVALCNRYGMRGIFTSRGVIKRAGDRLVRAVHADSVDVGAAARAGSNALLDVEVAEDASTRHAHGDLVRLRAAVPGREI
jgi:hypothetical protein